MKAHYAIYDSFGEIVKIYSGSQISVQCQDNEKYVLLNNTYLQLSNLQENYWYDNSSSAFKQKTEVDLNMPSEVNQNATVSFTVPSGSYAIVTGVTDNRGWRTSAISRSRSSDLMSASVTGIFRDFTAFTLTMPNRPDASVGSG